MVRGETMKTSRSNRDEVRLNTLSVPMTEAEKKTVESSARKEGLTMTAYSRKVFDAVSKVSLSRLIVLIENEMTK